MKISSQLTDLTKKYYDSHLNADTRLNGLDAPPVSSGSGGIRGYRLLFCSIIP